MISFAGLCACFHLTGYRVLAVEFLRLIGPMTSKHKVARTGMKLAFPRKSDAEINQLLKDMWDNLGRTFAEFPIMHRLKALRIIRA